MTPDLSRQERFDLWVSRVLPSASRRLHLAALRVSGGRLGSRKRGIPIGLLTMTGRRTGARRTVPLMYLEDGSRFLVVASNSGFDAPPAWLLNVRADPAVSFAGVPVSARTLEAEERAELWPRLVRHNPLWAGFQSHTARPLEVVALERR